MYLRKIQEWNAVSDFTEIKISGIVLYKQIIPSPINFPLWGALAPHVQLHITTFFVIWIQNK